MDATDFNQLMEKARANTREAATLADELAELNALLEPPSAGPGLLRIIYQRALAVLVKLRLNREAPYNT
jgi:hypothetical protein